ncbi:MAG: glycosyltransferase [Paludibacteraceae bacterium]|nr:glycosyltransferase [Paludibacteraceae bacterium]
MISLVMATYNGAKYIREQMDSILSQTLRPDEIIVVDDCSVDETISILHEYDSKCNIKIYENAENCGVNRNFEKAISLAEGDYIFISDQDDVWFPEKIRTTYDKLLEIEKDGPACVSSMAMDADANLNVIPISKVYMDAKYELALYSNGSQGCSLAFNKKLKDIVLPLCKEFIYDHYIGVFSCFLGERYTIGKPLMYYRHHGRNVVSSTVNKYHKGLSEAMAVYYLLKRKERLYLLQYLLERKRNFIPEGKLPLLEKTLEFYNVNTHLQMIRNVLGNKFYSFRVKFFFVVFVFSLVFLKNRRVVSMEKPF